MDRAKLSMVDAFIRDNYVTDQQIDIVARVMQITGVSEVNMRKCDYPRYFAKPGPSMAEVAAEEGVDPQAIHEHTLLYDAIITEESAADLENAVIQEFSGVWTKLGNNSFQIFAGYAEHPYMGGVRDSEDDQIVHEKPGMAKFNHYVTINFEGYAHSVQPEVAESGEVEQTDWMGLITGTKK